MRWRECVDRGLTRSDPRALERIPGSLASEARFLRAAEKNGAIDEYEMSHPAAYRSRNCRLQSGRCSMMNLTDNSSAIPVPFPLHPENDPGRHPPLRSAAQALLDDPTAQETGE